MFCHFVNIDYFTENKRELIFKIDLKEYEEKDDKTIVYSLFKKEDKGISGEYIKALFDRGYIDEYNKLMSDDKNDVFLIHKENMLLLNNYNCVVCYILKNEKQNNYYNIDCNNFYKIILLYHKGKHITPSVYFNTYIEDLRIKK